MMVLGAKHFGNVYVNIGRMRCDEADFCFQYNCSTAFVLYYVSNVRRAVC